MSTTGDRRAVLFLAALHVGVILASNYLVQIPLTLGPVLTTWGSFTFPFIFLATDLSVRVLGQQAARQVVMRAWAPGLVASYAVSVLFAQGTFTGWASLGEFNLFVFRIACASLVAYGVGQWVDIVVFQRLRGRGGWWLAPSLSTVLGSLIDTAVFFAAAFYRSPDAFMAENWPVLAATDYVTKLLISLAFYLPLYGSMVGWLVQRFGARDPSAVAAA